MNNLEITTTQDKNYFSDNNGQETQIASPQQIIKSPISTNDEITLHSSSRAKSIRSKRVMKRKILF